MLTKLEHPGSTISHVPGQFGSRLGDLVKSVRRNPTMTAGLIVIFLMVVMAIIAPLITTYSPRKLDVHNRLQAPSSEHWFGTDHVGRDVYARTIYGSRISLIVGFAAASASVLFGAPLGLVSGYFRRADMVLQHGSHSIRGPENFSNGTSQRDVTSRASLRRCCQIYRSAYMAHSSTSYPTRNPSTAYDTCNIPSGAFCDY